MGKGERHTSPQLAVEPFINAFSARLLVVRQDAGRVLPQEGGCVTSYVVTFLFLCSVQFSVDPSAVLTGVAALSPRTVQMAANNVRYSYLPETAETVLYKLRYLISCIKVVTCVVHYVFTQHSRVLTA